MGAMRKEKQETGKGVVGTRGGGFHYVAHAHCSQGGDTLSAAGPVDTPSESPLTVTAEVCTVGGKHLHGLSEAHGLLFNLMGYYRYYMGYYPNGLVVHVMPISLWYGR